MKHYADCLCTFVLTQSCLILFSILHRSWFKQASYYTVFIVRSTLYLFRYEIVPNHAIWLKTGPLRSNHSHFTINFEFSRLHFPAIRRDISGMFEHVKKATTGCDSLRNRITERLILAQRYYNYNGIIY